jgi:acyl carrier protein
MKTASTTDTFRTLQELIVETLLIDAEDIRPTSRLVDDLGADAVEAADLFVAIERQWDIEISHEAASRLRTVQDMADYIDEQLES